jgi:hypothetical protein
MIGPAVAQLPPSDRTIACRRLVQFLEAEEAILIKQSSPGGAASAQTPVNFASSQQQQQQQQRQPFLPPPRSSNSTVYTAAGMNVESSMAGNHVNHHVTSRFAPTEFSSGSALSQFSSSSSSLSSSSTNVNSAEVLNGAPPPPSSSCANGDVQVETAHQSNLPQHLLRNYPTEDLG